ncbi:MAG: AMP-dependent synthetase and ligase, partial [Tardiphaga sp.]|nr:AMP-dependent synthetase and ligase [Tardiphaga sp.]
MTDLKDAATLADVVRAQGASRADTTCFVFEGRSTSFGDFDRHTSQVANGLAALGVKPNERVAYLGKNSDTYFELLLGAVKA